MIGIVRVLFRLFLRGRVHRPRNGFILLVKQ